MKQKTWKHYFQLFWMGWIEIVIISSQTVHIADGKVMGAVILAFFLTFVWVKLVQTLVFGTFWDTLTFACGNCLGVYTGMTLTRLFYG
jgi:membrane protein required for beta-lactamase induction